MIFKCNFIFVIFIYKVLVLCQYLWWIFNVVHCWKIYSCIFHFWDVWQTEDMSIYIKLENEWDSVSFITDIRYSTINIFYMMKLLRKFSGKETSFVSFSWSVLLKLFVFIDLWNFGKWSWSNCCVANLSVIASCIICVHNFRISKLMPNKVSSKIIGFFLL